MFAKCFSPCKTVLRLRLNHKGGIQPRYGLPHYGVLGGSVDPGQLITPLHAVTLRHWHFREHATDQRTHIDRMKSRNPSVDSQNARCGAKGHGFHRNGKRPGRPRLKIEPKSRHPGKDTTSSPYPDTPRWPRDGRGMFRTNCGQK